MMMITGILQMLIGMSYSCTYLYNIIIYPETATEYGCLNRYYYRATNIYDVLTCTYTRMTYVSFFSVRPWSLTISLSLYLSLYIIIISLYSRAWVIGRRRRRRIYNNISIYVYLFVYNSDVFAVVTFQNGLTDCVLFACIINVVVMRKFYYYIVAMRWCSPQSMYFVEKSCELNHAR